MGKYGVKIKNIEAGILYECNLGVRDYFEYTNAMLSKSLFYEYILNEGMEVKNGDSTRDIICIKFGFGSSSYEQQLAKIKKSIKKANKIENIEERTEKLEKIERLRLKTEERADLYQKKTVDELRTIFYRDGISVKYSNGDNKEPEIIHYRMLYRTPGKAKQGSCMFIRDELYEKADNFLRMGIELERENAPIVEIAAYSSLITSTIVGKVHINPKDILILKDVESIFKTNVVSIETDENKRCIAKKIADYNLKNTLFDGQALIDSSIFPAWADGYVLLRHHFCKMAAFHARIQDFFKDYFGDEYENATVKDMFGNIHRIKDIKLITTDNAIKWIKFDISYDYWCKWVHKNGDMFGIVKTAHESKLGDVQRMSYQMVNALSVQNMESVVEKSIKYIEDLKTNDEIFFDFLKKNANFSNDHEVLLALVKQDPEFVKSEYFRQRRYKIVDNYINKFKNGKIIQNADNLVIVGSPYAMLLHSVGEDVNKDDTFSVEQGCTQCYTERFADGEYLAEFRSPFNSRNNLGYLHNVYSKNMRKYFPFGKQIIAINMIGTDFQDKNNGLITGSVLGKPSSKTIR